MFTVLKNASNVSTILGDYIFFRRTYTWHVWACLGLLLLSVMGASSADAASSWSAYGWMGLNCVLTSGYSLFLSGLVGRAKVRRLLQASSCSCALRGCCFGCGMGVPRVGWLGKAAMQWTMA